MFVEQTRRELAADFLKGDSFGRALAWDSRDERWPSDIVVFLNAKWPELDRCLRATEMVEREIRRCGQAWELTYRAAEELLNPGGISAAAFHAQIADFPSPISSSQGSLRLGAAAVPGLQVAGLPVGRVWTTLAHASAATTVYALSCFGVDLAVRLHTDSRLEGMSYGDDQMRVLEDVAKGGWQGSSSGTVQHWVVPKVKTRRFRAIAESRDEGGVVGGVDVVIWRTTPEGQEDLICVSTL